MEGPSEVISLYYDSSTHFIKATPEARAYPVFKRVVPFARPFVKKIGRKYCQLPLVVSYADDQYHQPPFS